jgi:MSHA biogenesis protein MshJ
MSEAWNKLNARVAGLSMRERAMVFFGLVAVMFMLADSVFFDPARARQKRAAQSEATNLSEIAQLQLQLLELARAKALDPDVANLKRAAQIKAGAEELEQKIRAQSAQMIEPERMGDLLKRLLAERPGVTLVGMKTIPQQVINLGPGGTEAPAPPAANRTAGTKPAEAVAPQQVALYRNGMQLVLRGGFLDLLAYLREVEKLPVKIYWDKLELTVLDFPVSQMTLVVNTIGINPAWMKI